MSFINWTITPVTFFSVILYVVIFYVYVRTARAIVRNQPKIALPETVQTETDNKLYYTIYDKDPLTQEEKDWRLEYE